ncbi:MAG: carbon-nitrogen hydrolase family protein [Burkholderiales bacterium]|nr:carbon-nitrogen hydrolase family protein [Burkholderiales bacterium]
MSRFAVASLQLALGEGDNRARIERAVALLVERFPWVQMVVLPELCAFGTSLERAETLPGETEQRFQALARRHGLWLLPGTLFERGAGLIYNTALVIDPAGHTVARYRKIYPFRPYEAGVAAGSEVVVFDVPEVGRFGVSICYDGWFPEVSRALVCQGAEVILHPTMTGTIDRSQELVIAQANAIMNQCYFVDVNNAGELGNGRSIVVGPEGEVLHQAGEQTETIPLWLDLAHLRQVRRQGHKGLGQILKSFRDTEVDWPCYRPGGRAALQGLGPLVMPDRAA